MDEMHVREDMVYRKHDGSLVGLVDLGDINNHIKLFEQSLHQDKPTPLALAKSMFVIIVRGLFTKLRFPLAVLI